MDIMESLLLEVPSILLLSERISLATTQDEIDKINDDISLSERKLLEWFSLDNFKDAKQFYQKRISMGKTTDLFGVKTKDLLVYIEKLINMKIERGM